MEKYKLQAFAFIILELFPEIVTPKNKQRLLDMENFYLKSLLPTYNILTEAGSNLGYKHTEISRALMSKRQKASYTVERRAHKSVIRKGKPLSIETRTRISAKKKKSVMLYNLDGTFYKEFTSMREAAQSTGCHVETISRTLKRENKLLLKQ